MLHFLQYDCEYTHSKHGVAALDSAFGVHRILRFRGRKFIECTTLMYAAAGFYCTRTFISIFLFLLCLHFRLFLAPLPNGHVSRDDSLCVNGFAVDSVI
jgi:hypothetical protein